MASPDAAMANFELPQASIGRIIKQALPANMQVSREAKLAFSKSASIFVLYLTSAANDLCRESKRKTINAQDIMRAVKELDFPDLAEPLQQCLEAYRAAAVAKRERGKGKAQGSGDGAAAHPGAGAAGAAGDAAPQGGGVEEEEDEDLEEEGGLDDTTAAGATTPALTGLSVPAHGIATEELPEALDLGQAAAPAPTSAAAAAPSDEA